MTTKTNLEEGSLVKDKEEPDSDAMVVITISEAPCSDTDEAFVKWDYKQNPVTVADENKQYGYDPEQPFAIVAFVPYLDRKWSDWKHRNLEFLRMQLDTGELKPYKYPVNRLEVTGQQF